MPYSNPDTQREYQRQWRAQRRAEWFEGKVCIDCGSEDELELDHEDPDNKITHNIWSWSAKRREEELKKCAPRCNPCHLEKTRIQRLERAEILNPCGTSAAYRRGCRCDACLEGFKAANQLYNRTRRPRAHGRI